MPEQGEQAVDVSNIEQLMEAEIGEAMALRPWIKDKFETIKRLVEHGPSEGEHYWDALHMITDSEFREPLVIVYYPDHHFYPFYIQYGKGGLETLHRGHISSSRRVELLDRYKSPGPYQYTDFLAYYDGNSFIKFEDIQRDCQHRGGKIALELRANYLKEKHRISLTGLGGYIERHANPHPADEYA